MDCCHCGKRSEVDNSADKPKVIKKQKVAADVADSEEKFAMDDIPTEKPVDIPSWQKMWDKGQDSIWNFSKPHRYVTETYDALMAGQKTVKILFPFCGKDVHMKWFADRGHDVVGVEAVESGAKQFFDQHYKDYDTKEMTAGSGKVYTTKDGHIRIYTCDFFEFTSEMESGFDAVWDRGAFGAASPKDQEKFAQVMLSEGMLQPDCRYYIETFDGDPEDGMTPEDVIVKCFQVGTRFNIKRLIYEEYVDESDFKEVHGHGFCEEMSASEQSPVGNEGKDPQVVSDSQQGTDGEWKMMVQVHVLTPCKKGS